MTASVPILFIPGILNSQLYLPESGKKLWVAPQFLITPERMDITSPLETRNNDTDQQLITPFLREGGMMKQNIFLIEKLANSFPDRPVYYFSYDFRRSCDAAADSLAEFLDSMGFDRVDVVCHSMGGLVTSAYAAKYGLEKIRKAVFLAVPFEGSPLITKLVITGDIREIPGVVADAFGLTREMLRAYPSVADLLPSREYLLVYPLVVDGEVLSDEEMSDFFNSMIPSTYSDSRVFRESIHASAYQMLLEYPQCYFGVGTGKSTIRMISVRSENEIEEICDYGGDTEVPCYSATMCGRIEQLGCERFMSFDCRHAEITKASEPLNWVVEKLGSDELPAEK